MVGSSPGRTLPSRGSSTLQTQGAVHPGPRSLGSRSQQAPRGWASMCYSRGPPLHTPPCSLAPSQTPPPPPGSPLTDAHLSPRVRPEVGLSPLPQGQWLTAPWPVAQPLTATLLYHRRRPRGESAGQLATGQPTILPLSSAALVAPCRSRWTCPCSAPHGMWGSIPPPAFPPPPNLLGLQVTAPGPFLLLALPGRCTLGARRVSGCWGCSRRTRVPLPSVGVCGGGVSHRGKQ